MKERKIQHKHVPRKKGKVRIFFETGYGNNIDVSIMGDPKGLMYLSDLLRYVASIDQEKAGHIAGERAHIHVKPGLHMGFYSCPVTIWRADAAVTGEVEDLMDE